MEQSIYLATLIGTGLVLAAAFSSLIAFRVGAPLLLLFLGLGLAAGTDGLGINFDNAHLAYFVGALALAVILFESGFGTPVSALRQAAPPALSLATVGVQWANRAGTDYSGAPDRRIGLAQNRLA